MLSTSTFTFEYCYI